MLGVLYFKYELFVLLLPPTHFSRLQRRRSNLQDLGRLSKSCPAVDSPVHHDDDSDSDSWGSSASHSDPLAGKSMYHSFIHCDTDSQ